MSDFPFKLRDVRWDCKKCKTTFTWELDWEDLECMECGTRVDELDICNYFARIQRLAGG